MRLAVVFLAVVLGNWLAVLQAGDWPSFRGANGDGIAGDDNVPTVWSRKQNIK